MTGRDEDGSDKDDGEELHACIECGVTCYEDELDEALRCDECALALSSEDHEPTYATDDDT